MPTGRGYPTAGYSAAAQQYRAATPLLDHIAAPTIKGVRDGLTFVTQVKTRSGVMQIAEPFLVPLETKPYAPYQPPPVSTASASRALARYAARLAPFAQAFVLGLELGDWLYDYVHQSGDAPEGFPTSVPYLFGSEGVDFGGDWELVAEYDSQINHSLPLRYENVWWFNTDYGQSTGFFSVAAADAIADPNNIGGTGPDTYIRRWKFSIENSEPWLSMDPTAWNFEVGQVYGGTTTPVLPPVATAAVTIVPDPEIDPKIPYDAIPHQDAWSNPLTERGPAPLPKVSSELFAHSPGRTYVLEVLPDGKFKGTSFVPPGTTLPAPPPAGTKERKFVLGKGGTPGRIFGTVTEIYDFVDCLFAAIPLKQRLKDGVTKRMPKNAKKDRRNPTGGKKFQDVGLYNKSLYIAKHFDAIDMSKAINCLVVNEIQDRGIGLINQMANTVTKNPYWVSPRGSGSIAPKF